MPQGLYHKTYHLQIIPPCHGAIILVCAMKNNCLQTDILKTFEQQICISSGNVCYVLGHYNLAWRSSDGGIGGIREGLMGGYVGRAVFSQSIKSRDRGSHYAFSTSNWCCSGHTEFGDSIKEAI